jgi:hypothetical protein
MTLTLSWTGLKRYEECHQLHRRVASGQALPQNSRIFLPGSTADRVMRAWLDQDDPKPGQMVTMVPDYLDRLTNHSRGDEDFREHVKWRGDPRKDKRDIVEFVTAVVSKLEPILMKWVVPNDYAPELKFRTTIGLPYLDGRTVGVMLIGGIDIVVRLPDGRWVLFDLKATKERRYIDATLGQGIFYDIAWESYYGEGPPVAFGFIAPALDEPLIWIKISDEDRRVMLTRMEAMAHGMWRGDWTPKVDNEGCEFCPARHVCDKFVIHLVKDERGRHRASFEGTIQKRRELRLAHAVPTPHEG